MRKKLFFLIFLSAVICFKTASIVFAQEIIEDKVIKDSFKNVKLSKPVFKSNLIEDGISKDNFRNLNLQKMTYTPKIIDDETVNNNFKNVSLQKPILKNVPIEDDFKEANFKNINLKKTLYTPENPDDIIVIDAFVGQHFEKPVYKQKIITENQRSIEIAVVSMSDIQTNSVNLFDTNLSNKGIDIGEKVKFRVEKDVYKDGKLFIAKNTPVDAIIGNVVPSSMAGAPAELTIERFITKDVNGNSVELSGAINETGLNLTPVVYLLAYGGYPFSFGASIFLLYLPGGQASIESGQEFTLNYEGE